MNCFQAEIDIGHIKIDKPIVENGNGNTLILFAHGAGLGMDSEFMVYMAKGLAEQGFWVVSFNFPYMQICAKEGSKRPPDRAPKLLQCFADYLQLAKMDNGITNIILMGKSMGGRMAAMLAETESVSGVICLGYPFLPPKKLEPRLSPLQKSMVPVLVIQGERDKFGNKTQISNWSLGDNTRVEWIADGDHSFLPRKSSGKSHETNMTKAIGLCVDFIGELNA